MKGLCQLCLKAKILSVEIAGTGIFLAFAHAGARHEVTVLLQ
jgi:hypothetical protein